jgi:hypothetical protein
VKYKIQGSSFKVFIAPFFLHLCSLLLTPWPRNIGLEMFAGLAQRHQFGDDKPYNQAKQRARSGIPITLFSLLHPDTAKRCAHYQQQQWQQINQNYTAQYCALGNRYDDFIADAGIDWVINLELARFAAKQSGQFARSATLAVALLTAISLVGLYQSILPFNLHYDGARLQHDHLPL